MRGLLQTILTELSAVNLWGFPVWFKRKTGGQSDKHPLVEWKHLQLQPPTVEELASWYRDFSNASAGIPSGPGTGFFALDTDSIEGDEYVAIRGLPETWRVRTRHGFHDYFRYPDFLVRNKVKFTNWPFPFDIRGAGGYVVAPGSINFGVIYHWVDGHSPRDLPLAEPPDWLLNELRKRAASEKSAIPPAKPAEYRGRMSAWARRAFDQNLQKLTATPPGQRNQALFDVARRFGQLVAGGEIETDAALLPLNTIAEVWPNSAHSKLTIARAFAIWQTRACSASKENR